MVPTAVVLAAAFVIFYVVQSVRTYFALRHFGGHWSAGWSRIWLLRTQSSGEMNKIFTVITDEYGELQLSHATGYLPLSMKENLRLALNGRTDSALAV
jgi:hypothetical protein